MRSLVLMTGIGFIFVYANIGCAQNVTYLGSLQYSSGSYIFPERTESIYIVNGFSVSDARGRITLNIPYVFQSSPWISYHSGGGIPTGGPQNEEVSRHGREQENGQGTPRQDRNQVHLTGSSMEWQGYFSDPGVNGSFHLIGDPGEPTTVNLNASVKIPLASPETGYGTGAWDYGVGISLFQQVRSLFLSGDISYWWFGDMKDLELNNPLFFSAGLGIPFAERKWYSSLTVSASTTVIEGFEPPVNLNIGIGHLVSSKTSLNGMLGFGLTESTSDFSASLGWSFQF